MKKIRVGINGFGRIGRAFFRLAHTNPEIEIVALNDLGMIENIAYLLSYDSVYGKFPHNVSFEKGEKESFLIVDGVKCRYLSETNPEMLPWADLHIDVVVESTGIFRSPEKAGLHLKAGAKKVVISAPPKKGEGTLEIPTILSGLNEEEFKTCAISSNASCTTNAVSPVISIMKETIGVEKAILNTVHAYTASQALVDGPNKSDPREGRAAAINIIPVSTGAAQSVTKAIKDLKDFDGISLRVPVPAGSIADITFIASRNTTKEEVNAILEKEANTPRWKDIMMTSHDPLVSSDIVGNTHTAIVDLSLTMVVGGNLVKVFSWYDNEMGYTFTLVQHVIKAGSASSE